MAADTNTNYSLYTASEGVVALKELGPSKMYQTALAAVLDRVNRDGLASMLDSVVPAEFTVAMFARALDGEPEQIDKYRPELLAAVRASLEESAASKRDPGYDLLLAWQYHIVDEILSTQTDSVTAEVKQWIDSNAPPCEVTEGVQSDFTVFYYVQLGRLSACDSKVLDEARSQTESDLADKDQAPPDIETTQIVGLAATLFSSTERPAGRSPSEWIQQQLDTTPVGSFFVESGATLALAAQDASATPDVRTDLQQQWLDLAIAGVSVGLTQLDDVDALAMAALGVDQQRMVPATPDDLRERSAAMLLTSWITTNDPPTADELDAVDSDSQTTFGIAAQLANESESCAIVGWITSAFDGASADAVGLQAAAAVAINADRCAASAPVDRSTVIEQANKVIQEGEANASLEPVWDAAKALCSLGEAPTFAPGFADALDAADRPLHLADYGAFTALMQQTQLREVLDDGC